MPYLFFEGNGLKTNQFVEPWSLQNLLSFTALLIEIEIESGQGTHVQGLLPPLYSFVEEFLEPRLGSSSVGRPLPAPQGAAGQEGGHLADARRCPPVRGGR